MKNAMIIVSTFGIDSVGYDSRTEQEETCKIDGSPTRSILLLNQVAVDKMASRHYRESIDLLRTALRQVASHLVWPVVESSCPQSYRNDDNLNDPRTAFQVDHNKIFINWTTCSTESESTWDQTSLLAMYNQPCHFAGLTNTHPPGATPMNFKYALKLYVPILYNLGLCLHLLAMSEINLQEHWFEMALIAYGKALEALEQGLYEENPPMKALFSMLIHNNMACAYAQLFRMNEAFQSLQGMFQKLTELSECHPWCRQARFRCQLNMEIWEALLTSCSPAA